MKEEENYTLLDKAFQTVWFLFILALAVLFTLWIMPGGEW